MTYQGQERLRVAMANDPLGDKRKGNLRPGDRTEETLDSARRGVKESSSGTTDANATAAGTGKSRSEYESTNRNQAGRRDTEPQTTKPRKPNSR